MNFLKGMEIFMIQTLHIVPEYNEDLIYPAICKSMEALNIAADLRPEMKIVIKPNMVMAKSPDFPATTHPLVVKAVIRWLKEQGMQHITIAESSGGLYNVEAMKHVYHVCGMDALSPEAELNMDFSAQTVNCPSGFKNHSFHLITPIVEADYIINICKLKTHAMTGYSGGIKNLFGTIPGLEKPQMHYRWPEIEDFSNMLLELAQTVAPQLTVIDAIDAMEGNGPTGGTLTRCTCCWLPEISTPRTALPPDLWDWIPWRSSCCDKPWKKDWRIQKNWSLSATRFPKGCLPSGSRIPSSWISRTESHDFYENRLPSLHPDC